MATKRRAVSTSTDVSSEVLTIEELEELCKSLPPHKKHTEGRKYIRKKSRRKATYWEFFIEYYEDGSNALRCECKFCDTTIACDSCTVGTTNVRNHAGKCIHNPENKGKGSQSQLTYKPGFGNNVEGGGGDGKLKYQLVDLFELRRAIVEMVILEECSFRFAESPGFVRVMQVACPQYICTSRFTIARDVLKLYKSEKMKLKELFNESCQRVSITTDTWTSNQKLNYMCITAHFIDSEWNLQRRIINFCPITSHKCIAIGKGIEECLEAWGIESKLYTVTVDNAAPNNTACDHLGRMVGRLGGISQGNYVHIRCMAHIINLIVWNDINAEKTSINRIRTGVKYIRNSPSRFQRLKDLAEKINVDTKALLSQDCPTRWNSTYKMLDTAVKLKMAIGGVDLPPSEKDDEKPPELADWIKVTKLVVFLKGFYTLTCRISGSLYLTSEKGLIEISGTLSMLNAWKQSGDVKMASMAVSMREKYDKYWGDLGKMNKMIYMAVILDPHSKFEVVELTLQDMFGKEKALTLVDEVKNCAFALFDEYRSMYSFQSGQSNDPPPGQSGQSQVEEGMSYSKSIRERAKRMKGTSGNARSEFERYLSEILGEDEEELEPLTWWKLNGHRYPIVSCMARDILAIPLSTVASECAFSAGGRQVDDFRSSLNPLTVQALICCQDWIRARNRKEMREMEYNLKEVEEFEKVEEDLKNVTLDEQDNVIYIPEP